MKKGIIVKAIAGFYYVLEEKLYECKLRGRFRLEQTPYVGDYVFFKDNVIEEMLERKNFLTRPKIANLDKLIIFVSIKEPAIDYIMIKKLILNARYLNIEPILVVNKSDLKSDIDIREKIKTYTISVKEDKNIDELIKLFDKGVYILAGPSGSGKSSFINRILDLDLRTNKVSTKLLRGRHTTTHVELLEFNNQVLIADSPGFSQLELDRNIDEFFVSKNYFNINLNCRFNNCLHLNEPNCSVKENDEVSTEEYEDYLYIIEEIKRSRKW